jgi:hypothetical protein
MADKQAVAFDEENVFVLQGGMNLFVKLADLVRFMGVSKQYIGELVKDGVLIRTETDYGPMYNIMDSVKTYMDSKSEKIKKTEEEKKVEKIRAQAEAKLKVAKAAMAELQAKELQGKMHRADDVQLFTQGMIDMVKTSLMQLPGQLAVDVSLCETAEEAQILIKDAVKEILREISEFDYDPEKYEALVRERQNLDERLDDDE